MSTLVRFELISEVRIVYRFYGALFVVTKWYTFNVWLLNINSNQSWKHKFLNSQTFQTIHHSQQGPGRELSFLGYLYFYAVLLAFQTRKRIRTHYQKSTKILKISKILIVGWNKKLTISNDPWPRWPYQIREKSLWESNWGQTVYNVM